jgi:branched-chain amino acid transport system ATP-binding protein
MSPALLTVRNLRAGYGEMQVLHDLSLDVQAAEIVALVGSNGAGKTTLLRALSHLLPWQGDVRFDGHSLQGLSPNRLFALGMAQVPEGRQLFDRMSVEENLLLGTLAGTARDALRRSLERCYGLFPILAKRRKQLAGNMSGGEQQMCALARALMSGPKLVMIDEMSLGLAPVAVDALLDTLRLVRNQGVTVLLVEQDVHSALHVADRAYVMESGRIVREGAASELADDPEVQRAYLGL